MKARLALGLIVGIVAIGASILIPSTRIGSTDLKIVLVAGGATMLAGVGIGVLIALPILRSLAYFRANRPDSFSWIGQKGPQLPQMLAKVSQVHPVSIPTYMIFLSSIEGLEIWRPFPRELITKVAKERIATVAVEAGYPRARLVLDVKASDGSIARLEVIPGSDRSGVFPANPVELQQICAQIVTSIAPSS